jgi:hypothetical protein
LALLVYQTHKQIWKLDMEHKHGGLVVENRRFKENSLQKVTNA